MGIKTEAKKVAEKTNKNQELFKKKRLKIDKLSARLYLKRETQKCKTGNGKEGDNHILQK